MFKVQNVMRQRMAIEKYGSNLRLEMTHITGNRMKREKENKRKSTNRPIDLVFVIVFFFKQVYSIVIFIISSSIINRPLTLTIGIR